MSTQTEHLHLDLREAADIFNPLSTNANFESLDNIIYEIQTKGGVPTYTTTAAANLLKLSQNPTPNVTVFKFVAAGDANTWSYQETVNDIVALDGSKKTVKSGEMYVAWVNAANAMVVIAWPDVVNAQTFDGKGPAEWATKAQLDAVNQTAANATTTAQAAATVANNALEKAEAAGMKIVKLWDNPQKNSNFTRGVFTLSESIANFKLFAIPFVESYGTNANRGFAFGTVAERPTGQTTKAVLYMVSENDSSGIGKYRSYYFGSDTSIRFNDGQKGPTGESMTNACVPDCIYGIK